MLFVSFLIVNWIIFSIGFFLGFWWESTRSDKDIYNMRVEYEKEIENAYNQGIDDTIRRKNN